METIIDVLHFLKRVEFINNDESEDYKKFHNIRTAKVDELVDILNLFDLLPLNIEKQNNDRGLDKDIGSLRQNIFQLVKEGKRNTRFAVNKLAFTHIR